MNDVSIWYTDVSIRYNKYLHYVNDVSFWYTNVSPIFKSTMPRERSEILSRSLRFDDHETRLSRISTDRLAPIREVLENINGALDSPTIHINS